MTETAQRRRRIVVTPRSRGALSGLGLVLLGIWGAVIPFIGPYWDYAYTPNTTWTWTAARFWLQVLPGAAAFLAGLVILLTASRFMAWVFALLGIVAGAWFVVGPLLAPLWDTNYIGTPVGDTTDVSVEQIGIFYGLGAAIILFAAFALGRFTLTAARDVTYVDHDERGAAANEPYAAGAAPAGATPGVAPGGAQPYPAAPAAPAAAPVAPASAEAAPAAPPAESPAADGQPAEGAEDGAEDGQAAGTSGRAGPGGDRSYGPPHRTRRFLPSKTSHRR